MTDEDLKSKVIKTVATVVIIKLGFMCTQYVLGRLWKTNE